MSQENVTYSSPEFRAELGQGCSALVSGIDPSYGYVPSFVVGVVFCVLFGIALIGHSVMFARLRRWTSILMALGALTELIGWAARAWAGKCPYNGDAFLMQITTLIIAPVFFSAALYVLLGLLILEMGRSSSLLSARMYAILFCTADVVSLVLQAIGGAMASMAADDVDGDTKTGTNIMVAGIVFQLGTMTLFGFLGADFLRRARKLAMARNVKLLLFAMGMEWLMIFIRGIYRTIELVQGWSGYLIMHEAYFIGFDAAVMVVAALILLILDPAVLLFKPGTKSVSVETSACSSDVEAKPRYMP